MKRVPRQCTSEGGASKKCLHVARHENFYCISPKKKKKNLKSDVVVIVMDGNNQFRSPSPADEFLGVHKIVSLS
ncbi:hypothetical protein POVWA2_020890 [Plasmodium ovale wallikeri]|uniref:Uncharacterized protein n=1 Tax=Plasmodium ovale wallikeri TaxID=864142 RepID=A0A1A8YT75_PLAOA|nr:hypothetical protein POVWA1_020680 [Plasmodium ovale wallikeri]SBT34627.1 hypothetical protein POVWA2_020890 [Plasmodium ovale wallikeri]